MIPQDHYECPRCGYSSKHKSSMRNHFYKKNKSCPATQNTMDLTDEIKEYILDNKIYKPKNDVHMVNYKLELELQYYKNKKCENFYQLMLENLLKATPKKLPCGITDITTDDTHIEIKDWKNWKEAIGQLMCYNINDPKEYLHVYLFGSSPRNKMNVFDTFRKCNIIPFEILHEDDGNVVVLDAEHNRVHCYRPDNNH